MPCWFLLGVCFSALHDIRSQHGFPYEIFKLHHYTDLMVIISDLLRFQGCFSSEMLNSRDVKAPGWVLVKWNCRSRRIEYTVYSHFISSSHMHLLCSYNFNFPVLISIYFGKKSPKSQTLPSIQYYLCKTNRNRCFLPTTYNHWRLIGLWEGKIIAISYLCNHAILCILVTDTIFDLPAQR